MHSRIKRRKVRTLLHVKIHKNKIRISFKCHQFIYRSELETRLEIFLAERKTAENSQESEREVLSNGVDDQSLVDNCKHVIKEV